LPVLSQIPGLLAISGRFAYVQGNAGLDGFKINGDGSLTAVTGSPFVTPRLTCAVGTSAGSPFLFAPEIQDDVSSGPQPVHVFRIDSGTGTLTEVSGSPFPPNPQVPQMGCVAAVVNVSDSRVRRPSDDLSRPKALGSRRS